MNSMVEYLGKNQEIKDVLLLSGAETSGALVYDICSVLHLKNLRICAFSEKKKEEFLDALHLVKYSEKAFSPDNVEIVQGYEADDLTSLDNQWALVFDSIHCGDLIENRLKMRPPYLVGTLNAVEVEPFFLWESFRKVSEHIYILSWRTGHHEEAMDWNKDIGNDVELSVIFPMYNIATYLPKCIESVTAWKADYLEFLFVDDGSPDNCADIVREYAKHDGRIKLLQKKNGGCASARQYGMDRARGRYIGFIDPDDYIDESMFKKLLSRALCGSYEISYCGYKELYEETGLTQEIGDVLCWPYTDGTTDPGKIDELIAHRRIAIWRGIYLKDLIMREQIHFYEDLRRFDDLPFKVETFARARSVVAVPEYLYYYRMSRPGQDVAANDERLYIHFTIFNYLNKFFEKMRDKRQLEYLEVVKTQTHRWALEKMEKKYISEYCRQARLDLSTNFMYSDGSRIIKRRASRRDWLYYIAIRKNAVWAIRWLCKQGKHKPTPEEKALKKLKALSSIQ